jgi:hypothetical protein
MGGTPPYQDATSERGEKPRRRRAISILLSRITFGDYTPARANPAGADEM